MPEPPFAEIFRPTEAIVRRGAISRSPAWRGRGRSSTPVIRRRRGESSPA